MTEERTVLPGFSVWEESAISQKVELVLPEGFFSNKKSEDWIASLIAKRFGRPLILLNKFGPGASGIAEQDPLMDAFVSRTVERAEASAQIVVQGSLAYLYADEFPYPVERFIPVDIYCEEWKPKEVGLLAKEFDKFFAALGFEVITHPQVVRASTHMRKVVKTPAITPDKSRKLDVLMATVFKGLSRSKDEGGESDRKLERLEQGNALAEIMKLLAETEKIKAETDKIRTERVVVGMEALNRFATALIKGSIIVSLIVGGTSVVNHASAEGGDKTVEVKKVGKKDNLNRLVEFLKKVKEVEEEISKEGGSE